MGNANTTDNLRGLELRAPEPIRHYDPNGEFEDHIQKVGFRSWLTCKDPAEEDYINPIDSYWVAQRIREIEDVEDNEHPISMTTRVIMTTMITMMEKFYEMPVLPLAPVVSSNKCLYILPQMLK